MATGKIKNWAEFQHYKDRSPPWIKLHRALLDDFHFTSLPLASKALAPMLWLLAAESKDGTVNLDPEWLAWRLRIPADDVREGLSPLIERGFLITASKPLAPRLQPATPETEGEAEGEGEECASKRPPRSGSRLPADWSLPDEWRAWASKERPDLDLTKTAADFADYWHAKPGKEGRKTDWLATWRRWVRNERSDPRKAREPATLPRLRA